MNYTESGWKLCNSYASLPKTLYAPMEVNPVPSPQLVITNRALANSLGLDPERLDSPDSLQMLAGNRFPADSFPLAQAYAGHQYGQFTMLGDGRAILIGEQLTPDGETFDIQLKGSGLTPFSRSGDGRAALGPMLREYIISESMHALGIPTSRSLAVVLTGEKIQRYSAEPGAILTRVASSHIRVGTFQFAAKYRSTEDLKALADYTIKRHFPEITGPDRYVELFRQTAQRQASLIAKWQLAGFVHGVMNTDNMAISGETIDYGPCAFLDRYDESAVFSSIDAGGRYAYRNQPLIGGWNLARFAESLFPLLDEIPEKQALASLQGALEEYVSLQKNLYLTGMREKLGLFTETPEDEQLINELLELMQEKQADYTNTFRFLTFEAVEEPALANDPAFKEWNSRWKARQQLEGRSEQEILELMKSKNPAVIPRNHRVEAALEAAAQGDYAVMEKLLDILRDPYAHSDEQQSFAAPPPPSTPPYQTYCGT
ncbi:YdiU family protein [Planococcus sp. CP5-4]|uniref:protein adenylyltransferase SelO n=1 Tax=unclassified Planococcus (in: firmicutes) TaxID=2662419 RepID=UPI001C230DB9|nr:MULTISPECIES: YdiU family protein [unclassified Planococcus (in: firmicutes)]MBU9674414.1 YdiU family protein [Planococcus sp. CP5-4_YE]MBV0908998.1 YdiU family protein [Planococcus sp. CP5-4_UN]MBW6065106.1 YdiU family protein [Planococcus sp. CP5-4]